MLYYYNRDNKFQKESSKEYKTEEGAVNRMTKEGTGSVFDETGKLIASLVDEKEVPEGALNTNPDGSVPAFDEEGKPVGTVDAATVAEVTGEVVPEKKEYLVKTTCDVLRVRSQPDSRSSVVGYIEEKTAEKTTHTILKESNGWGYIKERGKDGWIQLAYTKKAE